jgi:phage terminase large subunit-like protein
LELGLQIQSIGYDKYLAESHNTVHGILNLGYDSMRPVGQTPAYLSTPTKEVEVMMLHRRMNFYNPMVRWMFANVIIKADSNGNIKPDKAQSGNKIDGVSALVNAMHQFLLDQHEGEIIIDNEIYSF